jgi:hypothetical protein
MVCKYGLSNHIMSPSLLVAVVHDMNTKSPTLTAREYLTMDSQHVPEEIFSLHDLFYNQLVQTSR